MSHGELGNSQNEYPELFRLRQFCLIRLPAHEGIAVLSLALWAPGRGSPANRFVFQRSVVARAFAFSAPALVKQPARRRVAERNANVFQRLAADKDGLLPQLVESAAFDGPARSSRVDPSAPQNFVGHPIADARKVLLEKKGGLDWQLSVPLEGTAQNLGRESSRSDRWRKSRPPWRLTFAVKENYAAKLARIAEDE